MGMMCEPGCLIFCLQYGEFCQRSANRTRSPMVTSLPRNGTGVIACLREHSELDEHFTEHWLGEAHSKAAAMFSMLLAGREVQRPGSLVPQQTGFRLGDLPRPF